ncbi:proline dehydrogenase family protein [Conexibacter sp. DBS9H8]|uniref:proline dehydrogenase family protein n=1 Tax=Conexibacter sp. DBS9H8 TaxID=2937801 RepID=UPI0020106E96|nr:proline dehydrogenase family protein [Conexibacter sp. DBS9H8]
MSGPALEPEIRRVGRRLARAAGGGGLRARGEDRLMSWLSGRPELRAALFRTVDVAPACVSPDELAAHLIAFLPPGRLRSGLSRPLGRRAAGWLGGRAVAEMAGRFIIGESVSAAAPELGALWEQGIAVTVDLLGERTVTPAEAAAYARRCHDTLDALAVAAEAWAPRADAECDGAGALPRVNLSVKVTALTPLVRPHAPERGAEDARPLLRELLAHADRIGAHLHIDMESLDSRALVLELVLDLLAEPEFTDGPSAGIVLQAYLRDSGEVLDRVIAWAADPAAGGRRTVPLTVRLVKGAYWDHETILAAQHGWPVPVWSAQADSDRAFETLSARLIGAFPTLRTAIASHNLRSVAHAIACAEAAGLAPGDVEYQVLRGLGDDLGRALAAEGLRCRVYAPVGDVVAGMAYLVRRLLENTANDSFLSRRAGGTALGALLAPP